MRTLPIHITREKSIEHLQKLLLDNSIRPEEKVRIRARIEELKNNITYLPVKTD